MNKVRLERLEKAVEALPHSLFELLGMFSKVWSDERKSQIFLRSLCDADFLLLWRWFDGMEKRTEELLAQYAGLTVKGQGQWLTALPDENLMLICWHTADELNATAKGRAKLRAIGAPLKLNVDSSANFPSDIAGEII